jgi:two-component system OmpR family response regulator
MRILIVEDDDVTRDYIEEGLSAAGHHVMSTGNGAEGLSIALQGQFDAIVLDRMLPGLDGLALLRSLHASNCRVPTLFLTAVGGVDDRVEGLEAGADDYLVKPFALAELAARLSAIARRPGASVEDTFLEVADLRMDLLKRRVVRRTVRIDLQVREFALLEYFMRNEGRVLSKKMLLERVWAFNFDPMTTVLETNISRIRAKIDRPFPEPLLHTIKNVGYMLRAPR